jgi:DNA-binding MarR family transcriptional regulator
MSHTLSGAKFTELVLETFRLNGALIAAGDQLVGDLGLTSARWQVLGTLHHGPATVAEVARQMGLTRQNVQRIADCLVLDGFATTTPNPAHRRAKLYALSPLGVTVMEEVVCRQAEWANRIANGVDSEKVAEAVSLMMMFQKLIEQTLTKEKELCP